jgi:hypothetical protein
MFSKKESKASRDLQQTCKLTHFAESGELGADETRIHSYCKTKLRYDKALLEQHRAAGIRGLQCGQAMCTAARATRVGLARRPSVVLQQ